MQDPVLFAIEQLGHEVRTGFAEVKTDIRGAFDKLDGHEADIAVLKDDQKVRRDRQSSLWFPALVQTAILAATVVLAWLQKR